LELDQNDMRTVSFKIFDAFQGIIQYSYDGRQLETQKGQDLTTDNLCKLMTDTTKTPLARLGDVYRLAHSDDTSFDPRYNSLIAPWLDTKIEGSDGYRGWMWLSCNEFGWLQSTTNNAMFGEAVPITYLYKICGDLFGDGFDASSMDNNVRQTLIRYGYPWEYNATNVVVPVGGADPWSMIATNVTNNDTHLFSHVTPGAAHCSDMYPVYNGEPGGLVETRKLVSTEVDYYLSLPSTWSKKGPSSFSLSQFAPNWWSELFVMVVGMIMFPLH